MPANSRWDLIRGLKGQFKLSNTENNLQCAHISCWPPRWERMCFHLIRLMCESSRAGSRSKTQRHVFSNIIQHSTKHCFGRSRKKGNIIYNSKQISAYPADIILIARNTTGLEAILRVLETEGRKMWFIINGKKPRYTECSLHKQEDTSSIWKWVILNVKVATASQTWVSCKQWKQMRTFATKSWHETARTLAHIKLFKSNLLPQQTTLTLYKTIIRSNSDGRVKKVDNGQVRNSNSEYSKERL